MTVNSRKLWRTTSSMNNWLVLIVISNPGFVLKVSSVWVRSRYIWKYCWTPDYGSTFTFGDSTMWPKIGIIQHSIKIILHHANPCNHVYITNYKSCIHCFPLFWETGTGTRYTGDEWQLQIQLLVVADWLLIGYKHNYTVSCANTTTYM